MKVSFCYAVVIIGLLSGQIVFSMGERQVSVDNFGNYFEDDFEKPDDPELFLTDPDQLNVSPFGQLVDSTSWDYDGSEHSMPRGAAVPVFQQKRKERCPLPLAPTSSIPRTLLTKDEVIARANSCLNVIKNKKIDLKELTVLWRGTMVSIDFFLNNTPELDIRAVLNHLYPEDRLRIITYIKCNLQNELNTEPVDKETVALSSDFDDAPKPLDVNVLIDEYV